MSLEINTNQLCTPDILHMKTQAKKQTLFTLNLTLSALYNDNCLNMC